MSWELLGMVLGNRNGNAGRIHSRDRQLRKGLEANGNGSRLPGGNRRRDAPRAYINAIQLAKATSTNVRIAITFGAEVKKP